MAMDYKRIIYEPGRVTRIRMNRPRFLNALSHLLEKEMEDAFYRASLDPKCRVIVLSGEGRSFCSGHDVSSPESSLTADGRTRQQLEENLGSKDAAETFWWDEHMHFAYEMKMRKWRKIPKPTIAMVHGHCIFGGFFTAATMDLVFASEDALFLPPLGSYNEPPWDFSMRKLKEVLFEHRFIPAREAWECGFVSRIYPDRETLEKETMAYAGRVADNAIPTYISAVKQAMNMTMDFAGFSSAMDNANKMSVDLRLKGGEPEAEARQWKTDKGVSRSLMAMTNLKIKQEADARYLPR
jgi:enoyl-CoA hydratase